MAEMKKYRQYRDSIIRSPEGSTPAGELYRNLFENSHSIMLIIHPESGAILDANTSACSFYQYPKHELLKMTIMQINDLTTEMIYAEMQTAKEEKRNYFNFRHRLATGEVRPVEVYSSPIILGDQKVLYSIIHDISDRVRIEKERAEYIEKLQQAQTEITKLKGILPLCSFCKKIRDKEGQWHNVDVYIHHNSEADVSHTVCPDCLREQYPEFD